MMAFLADPGKILGLTDVAGGLLMLWSALGITRDAGLRTSDERWSLHRAIIYGCVVVSLFGLGVRRFAGEEPADWIDAAFQLTLLFSVVYFPTLRKIGVISQDRILLGKNRERATAE
jgi:hypothetical protein